MMDAAEARSDLRERYMDLNPEEFEQLCKIVTEQVEGPAYIQLTPFQGDGGLDITGDVGHAFFDARFGVQVKQYQRNIGEPSIRTFVGSLNTNDCQAGCYITSSSFTDSAVKRAENARIPIVLVDGEDLTEIIFDRRIGVEETEDGDIFETDLDFWTIFDKTTGDNLISSDEIPQANKVDILNIVLHGIDQGYRYKPEIRDYMEIHASEDWRLRQADYYATAGWCLGYVHKDTRGQYRDREMRRWGLTRDGQEYVKLIDDGDDEDAHDHLVDHIREMEIVRRLLPEIKGRGVISSIEFKDMFFEEVSLNRETSDRRASTVGQWLSMLPEIRRKGHGGRLEYEYLTKRVTDF